MLVVAEPYFRYTQTLGPSRLQTGAAALLDRVQPAIEAVYADALRGIPVRVAVRVERGSTKVWITVSTLVGALIFYGDVRQSIDYLIHDTKSVVTAVAPMVAPSLGFGHAEPAYRQRRLGVPGQLHRLFQAVERHDISPEEATRRAVDLLYQQGGPQAIEEAPGITERLSREFRAARVQVSHWSALRHDHQLPKHRLPDVPLLAASPEPIPDRRRSGVVVGRDPQTGKLTVSTY